MNILFVDSCSKKLRFGFKINKIKRINIYSLIINENIHKLSQIIIKLYFNFIFRKEDTYVLTSKYFEYNFEKKDNNYIDVTEQNNLLLNDVKYINEYIEKEKIDKRNIKVLLVFDEFTDTVKEKLNYYMEKYKIVDVFTTEKTKKLYSYVNDLNNKTGSVVEILDKLNEEDYNILLVFSNKCKISQSKRSFCLDYNNSELDVKSNTYLIYQNNKDIYLNIFEKLNLDINRFNKTKLGKLYIHASRIMLDK